MRPPDGRDKLLVVIGQGYGWRGAAPRISFEKVRRFCRIRRLSALARIHIQRFVPLDSMHVFGLFCS